jgi:hypothetical protein
LNFHRLDLGGKAMGLWIMPKRISRPKRPRDFNQLAYQLVQESTAEKPGPELVPAIKKPKVSPEVSRVMAAMGRKGGKIGAKNRMVKMTPEERSAIALNAAKVRWANRERP